MPRPPPVTRARLPVSLLTWIPPGASWVSRQAALPRPFETPGLADGDLGAVRVEGHVPGDLGDRRVRVLVGPDQVGLGAVRGLDAVVAGVALVGAVGLGGG